MWKIASFVVILIIIAIGVTFYKSSTKSTVLQSNTVKSKPITSTEAEKPGPQVDIPKTQVIATNLEVPWALASLPDGSILVTERRGTVRMIDKNGQLFNDPIGQINVKQSGESGLHGIAIHPKYPENPYVYVYYTYSANGENSFNRVSKFTLSDNNLIDEQIIVDKIPGATIHDGGRIKFGEDGNLYITTGDAANPSLSQDKNSPAGKILRVNDEGQPAPGNPFNTFTFSYGHRNPQGITWDKDGRLWEVEHGQTATDELNLIEPGKNYGWPTIRGDQKREGMVSPILQSGSDTWAPAGAAYFNNSIFFGGLRGQELFQAVIDRNTATLKTHFKGEFGRIRDVVLGLDNMLYITTSNRDGRGSPAPDDDKIIRVNPNKL